MSISNKINLFSVAALATLGVVLSTGIDRQVNAQTPEFSSISASMSVTDDGKTTQAVANSNYSTILIAQAFLDDKCPDKYVSIQGDTVNYKVKICGNRSTGVPTHYFAKSKKNGSSIFLRLSSYVPGIFVARNGKYTYVLDVKAKTLTTHIPQQRPRVERFSVDLP
jgi:hypothetical protein